MYRFFFTLAIFALLCPLTTQSQVTISTGNQHPKQLSVENLWDISIVNASTKTTKCYLEVTVNEINSGEIVFGRSTTFSLETGFTAGIMLASAITPVSYVKVHPDFSNVIRTNQEFPSGSYEVCWQLYNEENDLLAQYCTQKEIEQLSPPHLISPVDKAIIGENEVRPVFTWSPPAPVKNWTKLSYYYRIAEYNLGQDPYAAIWTNPVIHEEKDIISPLLQYPLEAINLEKEKMYVWTIIANYSGEQIPAEEVWIFSFDEKNKPQVIPVSTYWIMGSSSKKKGINLALNDTLRLQYTNRTQDTLLDYSVVDAESKELEISNLPEVKIEYGKNYLDIPLRKIKGLKRGINYKFIIKIDGSQTQTMLFYYPKLSE